MRTGWWRRWAWAAVVAGACAAVWSLPRASAAPGASNTARASAPIVIGAVRVTDVARSLGATPAELAALSAFYTPTGFESAWFDAAPALGREGRSAVNVLRQAAAHDLRVDDYVLGPLARATPALDVEVAQIGQADVALSLGVLRYMRHVHLGRVDPRTLGLRIETWAEPHDFPRLLRTASTNGRVADVLAELAPPFVLYRQLRETLERYRSLAARPRVAVPAFEHAVHPGEAYAGASSLAALLADVGDLPPSDAASIVGLRYDGVLVDGVRRFQSRHGLTADGVLGAKTVAALRVPLADRARQIGLGMERLRWLPDLGDRRLIAVNIPMFRLWAWDALRASTEPAFSMEVIVGKAVRRTRTPVFVETLQHVIFRPYWNVPRSILRDEVLPAARRDARYLARQQMEIVSGPGDDARVVPDDASALDRLAGGELRVRQRPGSHNSLGLVKFVFPNNEGVYMHGTPAQSLFARDRRDFSHGCIRVADPPRLAEWVLRGRAGWTADSIANAMGAETSQFVDVGDPIDVVLFYLTAAVLPDGLVHFAEDIYGHDAVLARALARR